MTKDKITPDEARKLWDEYAASHDDIPERLREAITGMLAMWDIVTMGAEEGLQLR